MFSKTLIATLTLLVSTAFASEEKFWMKDGQVFTCQNGSAALLTYETTFPDGSRLAPDGTLIMPDGTRRTLDSNQALSADGQLLVKDVPVDKSTITDANATDRLTETAIIPPLNTNSSVTTTPRNDSAPDNFRQNSRDSVNTAPSVSNPAPRNDSSTDSTRQNSRDSVQSNTPSSNPTTPSSTSPSDNSRDSNQITKSGGTEADLNPDKPQNPENQD